MTLADEDVNFLLSVWRAQVKSVHFHIKWEPVRARSVLAICLLPPPPAQAPPGQPLPSYWSKFFHLQLSISYLDLSNMRMSTLRKRPSLSPCFLIFSIFSSTNSISLSVFTLWWWLGCRWMKRSLPPVVPVVHYSWLGYLAIRKLICLIPFFCLGDTICKVGGGRGSFS